MANATETTKRAAVWNPPQLRELNLGSVMSGSRSGADWEGASTPSPSCPGDQSPTRGYRMSTSSEPIRCPYPWQ